MKWFPTWFPCKKTSKATTFTWVLSSGQGRWTCKLASHPDVSRFAFVSFIWPIFFQDVNLSDLSFSDSLPISSPVLLVSFVVVVCFPGSEKTVLLCFFKVAQVLHENGEAAKQLSWRRKHCIVPFPHLPVESVFLVIISGRYWFLL